MLETEEKQEILEEFIDWMNKKNVEHAGKDVWNVDGDWMDDRELIETFLE